jgi:hypothetical protein
MPLRLLLPLSLLLMPGCTGPEATVKPAPTKEAEPFAPTLSLRPTSVTLLPGGTQAFQAEINYPVGRRYLRQPVAWSVVEPEGGSITGAGVYTAPTKPGTYHVRAEREDFPEVKVTATVVVR